MNLRSESSGALLPMELNMTRSRGMAIGYWTATALFCLQMSFTAYAQLRLPQVAEAFRHLGFPAYFPAHFSVGDGPEAWGWPAATGVLWGLSYFFWRRLQVARAG